MPPRAGNFYCTLYYFQIFSQIRYAALGAVRTYGNPYPPTPEVHRDDTVKNEIVTVINDPRASLVTGSEQD
jgi:hypothetical protein